MLKIEKIRRYGNEVYVSFAVLLLLFGIAGFYGTKNIRSHSEKAPVAVDVETGEPAAETPAVAIAQKPTDNAKPSSGQKPKTTGMATPKVTANPTTSTPTAPTITPIPAPTYDATVLADNPVGYWTLSEGSASLRDKTANNVTGTYYGGTSKTTMPNQDGATAFSGAANTYAEIPDADNYSITTTKKLTWEAWIRPDTVTFVNGTKGYINWMGKCHVLSPTCEWMARFYNLVNTQNRCNRFSAYAFNPTASFGSGAYWQPVCGLIVASHWMHVVGEYQTLTTPSVCDPTYPGTIDIWVNGIKWDQSYAGTTGCMSQYSIVPVNNNSPIDIGTVSKDSWYQGAVGKLAIYNYQLTQNQITSHYKTMTGLNPSGSCTANCTLTSP